MSDWLERTRLLLDGEKMERLKKAHVAVFGIGGVGSFAAEALSRSGIGEMTLIDNDVVSVSNINRQLIATTKTVGKYKTDIMRDRILEINPEAVVHVHHCFFLPGMDGEFLPLGKYTYVVDAIDTVSAKLELALLADREKIPIISCMGTGNKLNPMAFKTADLFETAGCPLARVMRRELKARGINRLKVVYSTESPKKPIQSIKEGSRREIPGSISFVPSAAGLILAGEVIKEIAGI